MSSSLPCGGELFYNKDKTVGRGGKAVNGATRVP